MKKIFKQYVWSRLRFLFDRAEDGTFLRRFTVWRYRHIPEGRFVILMSIVAGLFGGLSAVLLKNLTHGIQQFVQRVISGQYGFDAYYFAFPLIGLYITFLIIRYVIRSKPGHGIPNVMHSILKEKSFISSKSMWTALITAPFTVGFGGSAGLEGPSVRTGAAIGSNVARAFHLNTKLRSLLLACGTAAALSAIFKVPITGIIFVIEVFSLNLTISSIIPLMLSSATGLLVSYLFLGTGLTLSSPQIASFDLEHIPYYVLLAVISAFISLHFTSVYVWVGDFFSRRLKNDYSRLFTGAVILGTLLFFMPALYGEGYETINDLLAGQYLKVVHLPWLYEWFGEGATHILVVIAALVAILYLKMAATAVTFGAGGVGGTFAPTLFIGATLGMTFALAVNLAYPAAALPLTSFTHVGMAGVMAAVMHAPLTAMFLTVETTGGYSLVAPLMIVSAVSFIIKRLFSKYSIYTVELARHGEELTLDKDKTVLGFIELDKVIETNFIALSPGMSLGALLREGVARSARNIFPVLSKSGRLLGVISMEDLRPVMFDKSLYEAMRVESFMQEPAQVILYGVDTAGQIMEKFDRSGAWNLPVVEGDKKYYKGFVSRSRLLSVYRRKMMDQKTESILFK